MEPLHGSERVRGEPVNQNTGSTSNLGRRPNIHNEAGVKREVKKLLDQHGFFWWMPPANGFGKGGISDFNALKFGSFLAVETKFGKNKPSALQVGYLNSVAASKGIALVVNEKTLDWFAAWLTAFDGLIDAIAAGGTGTKEDEIELINAQAVLTEMLR